MFLKRCVSFSSIFKNKKWKNVELKKSLKCAKTPRIKMALTLDELKNEMRTSRHVLRFTAPETQRQTHRADTRLC